MEKNLVVVVAAVNHISSIFYLILTVISLDSSKPPKYYALRKILLGFMHIILYWLTVIFY